ncbi:hypothetical protein TNCT_652501 [Trichonephila clavata]|uniref:Uncharacterized protein n=1 Tax=Trichonephila clavata TaxID=2740835 RepID=A0A8X6IT13_TRICU|nr:hypothetical protein TNCT_652501 [Trichonephila clavata]
MLTVFALPSLFRFSLFHNSITIGKCIPRIILGRAPPNATDASEGFRIELSVSAGSTRMLFAIFSVTWTALAVCWSSSSAFSTSPTATSAVFSDSWTTSKVCWSPASASTSAFWSTSTSATFSVSMTASTVFRSPSFAFSSTSPTAVSVIFLVSWITSIVCWSPEYTFSSTSTAVSAIFSASMTTLSICWSPATNSTSPSQLLELQPLPSFRSLRQSAGPLGVHLLVNLSNRGLNGSFGLDSLLVTVVFFSSTSSTAASASFSAT